MPTAAEKMVLSEFVESLISGEYEQAYCCYLAHKHDIAQALYERLQEKPVTIQDPSEGLMFMEYMKHFDIQGASLMYQSKPDLVGKTLMQYFAGVALEMMASEEERLRTLFPEVVEIVPRILDHFDNPTEARIYLSTLISSSERKPIDIRQ